MSKSAQEMFNEVVIERNTLKRELNKWIYTASVFERERDMYKGLVDTNLKGINVDLKKLHEIILKKT